MRPSKLKRWARARARFHLTNADVAMAIATSFGPTRMDEVATSRRHRPGEVSHRFSRHACKGQRKAVKRTIRRRYREKFGKLIERAPSLEELKAMRRDK